MSKKTSVKPVIQNGQIKSVEVEDVSLPLIRPLELTELPELIEAVELFFKYVDIEKFNEVISESDDALDEWDDGDLRDFVKTQLRDSQAVALDILTENDEITREEFIEKMGKALNVKKYRGWDLGGVLAGITMKSKTYDDYESPYSSEWRTVGNKWKCFYQLTRERYRPIIRKALKERAE